MLGRLQFRGAGRQEQQLEVLRHAQVKAKQLLGKEGVADGIPLDELAE